MAKFDCMMTFGIQPVTSSAVIKSTSRGNPLKFVPESQQCMLLGAYGVTSFLRLSPY